MSDSSDWSCPAHLQPQSGDVAYDLAAALNSVVMLKAQIPDDAFTASILGTERIGSGTVIGDDGLILTIGYLITEADAIWITANDGTVIAGHPLAYDFASGLGLVLPLGRLDVAPMPRGSATDMDAGDEVVVIGSGGRRHALTARLFSKRPFAGYWEYVLDEALFTVPAHPAWSGAAMVDGQGRLVGVGSLLIQEKSTAKRSKATCSCRSICSRRFTRRWLRRAARPGPRARGSACTPVDHEGGLVVSALADSGPAEQAGVQPGDHGDRCRGEQVSDLAAMFRRVWSLGPPGTDVPMTLMRGGKAMRITVRAGNRTDYLRKPRLQ
jgi:S1-C subfamily serine protease